MGLSCSILACVEREKTSGQMDRAAAERRATKGQKN